MSITVMAAVLVAAMFHAGWNLFVKRVDDKQVGMTAVVLGHTPFAIAAVAVSPLPSTSSTPWIAAGALIHVAYQLLLLRSYRVGDLSQVYPLARGVAPLLVAVVSAWFLGERLTMTETLGIATIAAGIIALSFVRRGDGERNGKAVALSLATGVFIAGYTLVDGMGAREAGTALGFYGWLSIGNALLFAAIMRGASPGLVTRVLTKEWRLTVAGGGASFLAYAIVTWAFTVAPIALVAALRETSIAFAVLFGSVVLRERTGIAKTVAVAGMLAGVVILRVA